MAQDDSKNTETLQRTLFRRNIHRIWEMLRCGRRHELSDQENDLAEILLEHEEYADHFENTEILDGRAYESGATFNPFLHISIHQMVEDQLSADSPAETALFCDAMEARGFSRHEAVHFVIMILLHILFASTSGPGSFDTGRYRRLLTRCRDVEPAEMEKIIADDLSNPRYRRDLH